MAKRRSDGDGSLYCRHKAGCPDRGQDKPKCKCPWQGAIVIGYRTDPESGARRAIRRKVTGRTKADAAANLRELHERIGANDLPAGKAITVEQWMNYWLKRIAARKVKPLTYASYESKVNQYVIPLLGHHRLDRLTPEHIEDAWDHLLGVGNPSKADPEPLSANTVHQTHRILSRALKVAVQRRRLRMNPAGGDSMDAPPRTEHDIAPMTQEEIDATLAAAAGQWNGARWRVALALGLRQGEALGLRWEDVDLDDGVLHVRQTLMRVKGLGIVFGTPKSTNSRRTVAIPATLLGELRTHRRVQNEKRLAAGDHWTDSGLVFTLEDGRPIDPGVDSRRWRALLTSAGVKHYRLHDARHSAATIMVAQGVDLRVAMKLLGHSQLSVTMRYQHVVDDLVRDAAERIDQAFSS
jgi:integrase